MCVCVHIYVCMRMCVYTERLLLARELRRSRSANALHAELSGISLAEAAAARGEGTGETSGSATASPGARIVRDGSHNSDLSLLDLAQVKSCLIIVANRLPFSVTRTADSDSGDFEIKVRAALLMVMMRIYFLEGRSAHIYTHIYARTMRPILTMCANT